jgi:hypothetical protein
MQGMLHSVADRERRAASRLRSGLTVSVVAIDFPDGQSQLRGRVRGGMGPVHLYLYVDGELTESWARASETFTFDLGGLGAGRHAVTTRAIDATGCWSGASVVVAGRG